MITFLMKFLTPIWGYLAAGAGIVITIVTFGAMKKRQGRKEKESQDREQISKAVKERREVERTIRQSDPNTQLDRVRAQRDKLRRLLRTGRRTDN